MTSTMALILAPDLEVEMETDSESEWSVEMETDSESEMESEVVEAEIETEQLYDQLLMAEIIPIPISGDHISDNNSITSSCPICHDDFELGEEVGQLHYAHIFHPNCVSPWLRRKNTCPVCRREF